MGRPIRRWTIPQGACHDDAMAHPRNSRLDPTLYASPGRPCFHTIRCTPGQRPFARGIYARIAVECLLAQQQKSCCRLDVYCVMPDHIHAITTPETEGTSSLEYLRRFKGWCSREMRLAGWPGEIWQKRSYDHLLRRDEDIPEVAAYILANPVRAGLCASPEDYPWSGLAEIYS
jgi:putative transposase